MVLETSRTNEEVAMKDIDDLELVDLVQNQVPHNYHHNFWYAILITGGWKFIVGLLIFVVIWSAWFD